MTRPTRHQTDEAKSLAATIEALRSVRLDADRIAHVIAHAADCDGAEAWGSGSTEVAVATSGLNRPTERRALDRHDPDAAVAFVGDLRQLVVAARHLLGRYPDVLGHWVPEVRTAECGECSRRLEASERLKRGLCTACYLRARRSV